MINGRPRVLIEEWLPIVELGIESRREAAPIPGQFPKLKTLHVWWARRPLAASVGTVLASLLPVWTPDLAAEFPDDVEITNSERYRKWFLHLCGIWGDPVSAKAAQVAATAAGVRVPNPYSYKPAFKNSPSTSDLALLQRVLTHTWGEMPAMLDPTAGGGSIPYVATRFGIRATANDLNAVAAVILRAGVETPAALGPALVHDLNHWGEVLVGRISKRLTPYFESGPGERIATYLFARSVACPRTGKSVPLSPSWWLSTQPGKQAAVKLVTNRGSIELDAPEFDIVFDGEASASNPDVGTVAGGGAVSPWDGLTIDGDHIKSEAREHRMSSVLYAVSVRLPVRSASGKTKWVRTFRAPTQKDLDGLAAAEVDLSEKLADWLAGGIVPSERIPEGNDTRPHQYGMPYWRNLFSPRQLLVHGTFVDEFGRLVPEVQDALDEERARAVLGLLAAMQGKALNANAVLASWDTGRDKIRSVFDRHDFAFKWTFAEFEGAKELFPWCLEQLVDAYTEISSLLLPSDASRKGTVTLRHAVPGPAQVLRENAGDLAGVADRSQTLVCIDPPYYDNVMYGELSDFFGVWEQHTAGQIWPDLMPGGPADIKNEAVANGARFADSGRKKKALASIDYEAKMGAIFAECHRVLRDDGVMTVMFTHKKAEAWDTLGMGLMEAGFTIETSWPVNTESEQSLHQAKKNAAASTVMLVCRKRLGGWEGSVYFEDIEAEVRSTARDKAQEFAAAGINGVDLLLSSYGPALSVISRHWPVMSSEVGTDGASRRLRPEEALDAAREEIVALRRQALVGRQVDFDPLTDFVLLAWSMFQAEEFPYDEARRMAMAVGGNDVETLAAAKILTKKAGTVVLAKPADRRKRVVKPVLDGQTAGLPLVDVLHAVMVIADADGLSAAKGVCDRLGLLSDQRFVSLVQAMVRAIPRTRKKGKFIRSESDVLDRFCTAYLPQVELPVEESDTLFALDG